MKAYYPVDATGNRIGLKTPEAAIYDASGTNLTTKINNINSGISNRYTKSEVDSKVTSLQNSINTKYSATGGTLNGNINFPEAGATNASSHGITWSGSTDTAKIYYKTTSQDQGNLVLQMGDDANSNINFEWNISGNVGTKAYITSDGVYHGKATNASYADSAGSANSVAWGNVSGKPSTYTPSSHTHSIDQISNLQNTINTINSNKADKSSFTNAGYNSWVVIRNDGTVGVHGTYPTSGWSELIVVLRYTDSNQTEFHNVPCVDGKPWFAFSDTNGCYMGKGDRHDATSAYFTKYGAYFNTTGQFAAGSLTAVYIYGRKKLW